MTVLYHSFKCFQRPGTLILKPVISLSASQLRSKSAVSAIKRGIIRSGKSRQQSFRSKTKSRKTSETARQSTWRSSSFSFQHPSASRQKGPDTDALSKYSGWSSSGRRRLNNEIKNDNQTFSWTPSLDPFQRHTGMSYGGAKKERVKKEHVMKMPVSVPYTTASSEFLYGHSVVVAALEAQRRKMYKIYIHPRALGDASKAAKLKSLAKQNLRQEDIRYVDDEWLGKMNKMAADRPHNVSPTPLDSSFRSLE